MSDFVTTTTSAPASLAHPPAAPETEEQFVERYTASFGDAKPQSAVAQPSADAPPAPPTSAEAALPGTPVTPAEAQALVPSDGKAEDATKDEAPSEEHKAPAEARAREEEDDTISEEFAEAAVAARLPLDIDDLPEEARPLVRQKLKDMESGFTRAMQQAREYRAERAQFLTDKAAFEARTKNPRDYIVDLVAADPALLESVNTELDKLQDPYYVEERKRYREAQAKLAAYEAREQADREERRATRMTAVIEHVQLTSDQEGIPVALVEEAIALAIREHERAHGEPDVSDAEIERIVQEKARAYRKAVGHVKRVDRKQYLQSKASDKKAAAPRVTHAAGSPPTPAPKAKPTSVEAGWDALAAKLFPDAA